MTDSRGIAAAVHDAIDEVTSAVEDIHKSIAGFPLDVLGEIAPLKDTVGQVKNTQAQTIAAVYGLVRRVNDRVRQLTTGADAR